MKGKTSRLLVLSDIHGHADMAGIIAARHPGIEGILIAGDITNFGNADAVRRVLDALKPRGGMQGVHGVSGNCDTLSARRYFSASGLDLEAGGFESSELFILGAGGGLRRAGITSFERSEGELEAALGPGLDAANKKTGPRPRTKPLIVVTHSPPYGTNADLHAGMHVGSKTFSRLMGRYGPEVWICGHIHESRCVSLEDGTLVINPGPCALGYHAILEIGREGEDQVPELKAFLFSL
ncbi:MAG: metallophosphoesterase family protein [Spirochaetia bacterium]|jgi:Icc-related predicted phosphoesterase|nr:metallophosphoesterase family protein [Spirochaetia bacterium]